MTIAEKLVKLRGSQTRANVAKEVGISVSALQMYENGQRIPRDSIKVKLAKYYGVTVEELFFNTKATICAVFIDDAHDATSA